MEQKTLDLLKSFNNISSDYDNETNTFHHKITEYLTINNLLEVLPKDRNIRVLDSGGGTGKYSIFLSKLGYEIDLIDISEKSINIAKEKAKKENLEISTYIGNSEKTLFENEFYDFVMMNGGVISYTPNPQDLLNEAFRILKPGGLLFFDFLNSLGWAIESPDMSFKSEIALADERLIQMSDWDYPARIISIEKMKTFLGNSGFKIHSQYGLVLLSNSLPLDIRYSKKYDKKLLEKYKEIELKISRKEECIGSSWSCSICAIK
jgi:ubiquinone/menaquinone biosynthesis C-methylase UbiE